jgi:hypothetical protein
MMDKGQGTIWNANCSAGSGMVCCQFLPAGAYPRLGELIHPEDIQTRFSLGFAQVRITRTAKAAHHSEGKTAGTPESNSISGKLAKPPDRGSNRAVAVGPTAGSKRLAAIADQYRPQVTRGCPFLSLGIARHCHSGDGACQVPQKQFARRPLNAVKTAGANSRRSRSSTISFRIAPNMV